MCSVDEIEELEKGTEVDWDSYLKAYYEKPRSAKTWSGFDMKEIYIPKDRVGKDYDKTIADALVWGATNSASVIEHIGPQAGLLTTPALLARIKKHKCSATKI